MSKLWYVFEVAPVAGHPIYRAFHYLLEPFETDRLPPLHRFLTVLLEDLRFDALYNIDPELL
jgi:hypothetical protein